MKLNKMNKSLIGIIVAVAAVSCSDELVNNDGLRPAGGEYSDDISFVVYDNNSTTRGGSSESRRCGGVYLLNTAGSDSLYMQMEVSDISSPLPTRGSDITPDNIEEISITCRMRTSGNVYNHYFADLTFSKTEDKTDEGSYIWKSTPDYYWLNAETHFNFYGYAPADAKGVTYNSNSDLNYIPTLDYTVDETASDQIDLVYHDQTMNTSNYETNTDYEFEYIANAKQIVPLNMKHALSKVVFKTGDGMAAGAIKRVTIKNVYDHGTLNLSNGNWDIDKTTTKDFYITKDVSGDNQTINEDTDGTYFFLLPESTTEDTEVFIEFLPEGATEDDVKTYTASLQNTEWKAGKQYIYTIKITPDLEITLDSEIVDAHYVIANAKVIAEPDQNWEIEVSINGNPTEKATITNELDEWQQKGYWTDRILDGNNNNKDKGSARGTESLSGQGESGIFIFVPENISGIDRSIIIKDKSTGMTIKQFTQLKVGDNGWEQICESEGEYGYNWTRKVCYGYKYDCHLTNITGGQTETQVKNYCESVINDNQASQFAYAEKYTYNGSIYPRYQIVIDYSKMPVLQNETNETNGLNNTKNLNNFAGETDASKFEEIVKYIKKNEEKVTDIYAFGVGEGNKHPHGSGVLIEGDGNPESTAVHECIKKNKHNIVTTITSDGVKDNVVTQPVINDDNIVWYLPAVDEFNNIPNNLKETIITSECWTSTAIVSSNDNSTAYLGNRASENRLVNHKIRACRVIQ